MGSHQNPPPSPPSADSLRESIDVIIGPPAALASCRTESIRPRAGSIARLGLALEPWPGLAAWTERERLDGLFLHRHWALDAAAPGIAVVSNHDGFDRRFGFGYNPELHAALGMRRLVTLAQRDGYPLGTVAQVDATSSERLRAELVEIFGGVDEEVAGAGGKIERVAVARAMTVELVEEAAALGAQACVTGQLRRLALGAAAEAGVHLFAVGHRRSELWGLQLLAAHIRARWPAMDACLVADPQSTEKSAGQRAGS